MPARPHAAADFHALHREFLILPNAWNAVSAKIAERAGAQAVATSSAAVAWACGYADGHDLPFARLVEVVEDIARVTRLPISVDAEGGYADDPARVGENVAALIGVGAVGINLEDGRDPHELHLRKIEAARAAAARERVDLFINARTDVFIKQLAPADQAAEETIRRGRAFRDAGASGLFAPLALKPADIGAIAEASPLPLNVLAWRGLPDAAELRRLGVRRLSAGAGLARAAFAAAHEAALAFLTTGKSDALVARDGEAVNYNALIKG
ncbi:MAG: isocitrate lyase/phosphoenolpyruvate mutase family protein [Hyphomonadaceae bacterium]|nr:isocitrate lyase/phosphoenolpyruvate mutase family protein [Hyphomonadaceae bacterium]